MAYGVSRDIKFFFIADDKRLVLSIVVGISLFALSLWIIGVKNKKSKHGPDVNATPKQTAPVLHDIDCNVKEKFADVLSDRDCKPLAAEQPNTVDWEYDASSQTLSITGHGHMPDDWHTWGTLIVRRLVIGDGVLSISKNAFCQKNLNVALRKLPIDFGKTLQSIGDGAFAGLDISDDCTFPPSLTSIGSKPFTCHFKTVIFTSQNPPEIADFSFLERCEIVVPKGCLKRYVISSRDWQRLACRVVESR